MNEQHRHPAAGQKEVVERREVVERSTVPERAPARAAGAGTGWIWLLLLLLVVVGLVWFIFSRGEPQRPLQNVELNVPNVEVPTVREERRIEVQVPTATENPPAQPAPQQP
jgi:uncharacterized protein HemX